VAADELIVFPLGGGQLGVPPPDNAYDMSDVEKACENYALIVSWIKRVTQPSTP
jgi:hypothetical protein